MVGTGVFTSLGFQLDGLNNSISILLLWTIGGLISLAGAFSYAEIGSSYYRKSGGEYHFISELYNKFIGYLAGWVSLTVGFAAPVALAAMAFGTYMTGISDLHPEWLATAAVVLVSGIHSFNLKQSSIFQNFTTTLKIILIVLLVLLGLYLKPDADHLNISFTWLNEITTPFFAISLIYVSYSYSGWNAAAYIVEEIKDVTINLPKALIRGTVLVTLLYVGIHFVFLRHVASAQMLGKLDVGHIFATHVFGENGGLIISGMISFFLLSSVSAMIWVGPRVSKAMADDYTLWSFLKKENSNSIPIYAIWFQASLSLVMIWTGTFEQILLYCGFMLQLSAALCVFGSFIIRRKKQQLLRYKSPFHPIFPILFLAFSLWIIVFLIIQKPFESMLGMLNLLIGALTYYISKNLSKNV